MTFQLGVLTAGAVTTDPRTGRPPSARQRVRDTVEQGVVAEQVGLDVLGVGEQHAGDSVTSSPAVLLAAVAARTSAIRLTSAVTVLASLDPVRLFQDFATLDLVSGGRAEVIAGRGSFLDSFPLFGLYLDDHAALFAEKLHLLLDLREEDPITWFGRFRTPLQAAVVAPRPVQAQLPVHVAVPGSSSAARVGRLGLPMVHEVHSGRGDRASGVHEAYRAAAAEAGHDPAGLHTTVLGRDLLGRGALGEGGPQQLVDELARQHERYGHDRLLVDLGDAPQREHLAAIERLGAEVAPVLRRELAGAPVLTG